MELVLGAPSDDESGDWVAIDDGAVLLAKLTGFRKVTKSFVDKETGEPVKKFEFSFQITDPNSTFEGRKISGETSTNFVNHPKCKAYSWIQALLGSELPQGFKIESDQLIGSEARLQVFKKVQPRIDGQGDWITNGITKVLPSDEPVSVPSSSVRNYDFDEEPF